MGSRRLDTLGNITRHRLLVLSRYPCGRETRYDPRDNRGIGARGDDAQRHVQRVRQALRPGGDRSGLRGRTAGGAGPQGASTKP